MITAQWFMVIFSIFLLNASASPLKTNILSSGQVLKYKNGTIWNIGDPTGLAKYKDGTTELIYGNIYPSTIKSPYINGTQVTNSTNVVKRQSGAWVYIDYYWDAGCSNVDYQLAYNPAWCEYDFYLAGTWSNQMVWSDFGTWCDVWSGPNRSGTYLGTLWYWEHNCSNGCAWTAAPNCLYNYGEGATTFRCGACS
jgi:hypothetical protein